MEGIKMSKCFMYHEDLAPEGEIVESKDIPKLEKAGYVDTPAKFGIEKPKPKPVSRVKKDK
jgi:hypothetical protein